MFITDGVVIYGPVLCPTHLSQGVQCKYSTSSVERDCEFCKIYLDECFYAWSWPIIYLWSHYNRRWGYPHVRKYSGNTVLPE